MISSSSRSALKQWRVGPGLLVTAAFIGPGTVATASRAGAEFGFALLWTLLFAVVATIVLQEMAARLGLVARKGLAEAIRDSIRPVWLRRGALSLVLIAIVFGNTAYQTGNLIGAGLGLSVLTGCPVQESAAIIGLAVALILGLGGTNRIVHAALIAIVLIMSAAFVATAAVSKADVAAAARGLVTVSLPIGSLLTAMAMIGTTVVPYNLFLHATLVQRRWQPESGGDVGSMLRASRLDTFVAISIGGLVTMAIVATANAAFRESGTVPADAAGLARQLDPLFGYRGKWMFAAGLTAAGLTSAITAPLAAGYVAAGAFPTTGLVRGTAVSVALIGAAIAYALGKSPQVTIVTAQAANGLLLPFLAVFLLGVMNRRALLGDYRNRWPLNVAGGAVVIVAVAIGIKSLVAIFC